MSAKPPRQADTPASPGPAPRVRIAVLGCGFRPFFALAGLHAALAIPVWMALLHGVDLPGAPLPPLAWHAHEMIYGFVMAAIAGFLLTAVPGWTASRAVSGAPLAALVLVWLAGRVAMSLPLALPATVVAVVDLAFPLALALAVAPTLIRAGKRRNLVFVALLALLFAANLHFHIAGGAGPGALTLAVDTVALLTALVGGRVTPAFTSAWLERERGEPPIAPMPWLDTAAVVTVAAMLVVDVVAPGGSVAGTVAGAAAVALALRVARWRGHRTLAAPLVWVLHLGYAWLAVGLGLKSAALLGAPLPGASGLHALTAGAFSTLILGVMTRATLGHTGRALAAPPSAVAAYLMVTAGALCRVFGPAIAPGAWTLWLAVAGALWSLGFCAFLAGFAPMLWRPRVDGRPG